MVCGGDERSIAGEHDDEIVGRQRFARDHQGVSGAALLLLQHEPDAGGGHRAADAVGFMSDDGENVAGRDHSGGGCDHVGQKRLSANFVQHLGMLGLQPGPFARGQDGDGGPGRAEADGCWLSAFDPIYRESSVPGRVTVVTGGCGSDTPFDFARAGSVRCLLGF